MTSAINYLSINENFPVAGQDNDTQVFRDNFDTIKNNFRAAQEEITVLQTVAASVEDDNDFNNNIIAGAIFQRSADLFRDLTSNPDYSSDVYNIDWEVGSYQKFSIPSASVKFTFQNFYNSDDQAIPRVGKVLLELTKAEGEGGSFSKITFETSDGTVINKIGFPNIDPVEFGEGGDLIVESDTEPVFIEVWQHSINRIFLKYVNTNIADLPTPAIGIGQITDVTITTPNNSDSLRYETIPNKWVNANYDQLITYTIKIADNGSGTQSVFYIDDTPIKTNVGVEKVLSFVQGNKYRFDISDPSNAQGPLKFSNTPDTEVPSSVTDYTTGVTRQGTAGTAGAYVDIIITAETPSTLYLWAEEVIIDTSNVGGSVKIQKTVNQTYTGSEDLSPSASASLTKSASYFTTAGAETATLADGTEGQIKVFAMRGAAGNMVITVNNPGWKDTATGTITFDVIGDACTLQYIGNKWFCIGNNGAVFA
jgi:hypothetical protein